MAIRKFKPYTPGTRQRVVTDFSEITSSKPERSLIVSKHRVKGRNNRGVITCRHRGGGHKRQYRLVDFRITNFSKSCIAFFSYKSYFGRWKF